MPIQNVLASVAVRDLSKAKVWYERLFERPPDATPMREVLEQPERAGASSCTLVVTDFDAVVHKLQDIGLDTSNATSEHMKVVMIKDPDGNSIALAETLDVLEQPVEVD